MVGFERGASRLIEINPRTLPRDQRSELRSLGGRPDRAAAPPRHTAWMRRELNFFSSASRELLLQNAALYRGLIAGPRLPQRDHRIGDIDLRLVHILRGDQLLLAERKLVDPVVGLGRAVVDLSLTEDADALGGKILPEYLSQRVPMPPMEIRVGGERRHARAALTIFGRSGQARGTSAGQDSRRRQKPVDGARAPRFPWS